MDDVINKLIRHIKKNKIKYITISESNHRSYTSHTFQYKFVKALYENNIIDTFSSERMGINDSKIIDYYLENGLDIDEMIPKLFFGGMGFYRIFKYFSKKSFKDYKIVGLEEDNICKKVYDLFPKDLKISKTYNQKEREEFWLNNIKKIVKERGNLFINGYHLSKDDIIGKYFIDNFPKETLILSMASLEIKTQILLINRELYPGDNGFNRAIEKDDYITKVQKIDRIAPPTKIERKAKGWKLIKVDKHNRNEKIRAVGCYLALYEDEYKDKLNIVEEVSYKLKNYDYLILFEKSIYREKMVY